MYWFQSQRFENQSGNKNFNGAGQRSNFSNSQRSQNQKPFNNSDNRNNMNYGASFYQNPPTTQESKIEGMLDHVLDGQQNLTMDYKGKIDDVYTNLNEKFEALSTHVKKLETGSD